MPDRITAQLTALVITHDEEPNIARCLERLRGLGKVLVVDSGSTDRTVEIATAYPGVTVVHRPFDDFASQCNFGLKLIETPWVLSLDADYELSEALANEIAGLEEARLSGYSASFVYRIFGRPLSSSLYPPRTVLYRRDRAIYRNEGHGHRVLIEGEVGRLVAPIFHDDRKPLSRWLGSQQRYAVREVDYLLSAPADELSLADRLRRAGWPMPVIAFFYALLWKGCLLDGWPGWLYVLQRVGAETIIALELIDRKLRRD